MTEVRDILFLWGGHRFVKGSQVPAAACPFDICKVKVMTLEWLEIVA
jgi:hypothetical protein